MKKRLYKQSLNLIIFLLFCTKLLNAQIGNNWCPMPGITLNGKVNVMIEHNNKLYIAGDFVATARNPTNGDIVMNNIASWDGQYWNTVAIGTNGPITAMVSLSVNIYVGGIFTTAGGIGVNKNIARWDGLQWNALPNSGFLGPITEMKTDNTNLFVLHDCGNNCSNPLVRWAGGQWFNLQFNANGPNSNYSVNYLNVDNNYLTLRTYPSNFNTPFACLNPRWSLLNYTDNASLYDYCGTTFIRNGTTNSILSSDKGYSLVFTENATNFNSVYSTYIKGPNFNRYISSEFIGGKIRSANNKAYLITSKELYQNSLRIHGRVFEIDASFSATIRPIGPTSCSNTEINDIINYKGQVIIGGDFNFSSCAKGLAVLGDCQNSVACTVSPKINCIANITKEVTNPTDSAYIYYDAPTFITCCDSVSLKRISGTISRGYQKVGVSKVVYAASDTCGHKDTCSFFITVNSRNNPRQVIAKNDTITLSSSNTIALKPALNDVLAGSFGSLAIIKQAKSGRSAISGLRNDSLTYTANPGFSGTDSIDYQICDLDGFCDTATIYFNVNDNSCTNIDVVIFRTDATCGINNGSIAILAQRCNTRPLSFNWSGGLTGVKTSDSTSSVANLGAGTYSVTVSDGIINKTVSSTITTSIGIPKPAIIRQGQTLTSSIADRYLWFRDGINLTLETSQTIQATITGTYKVRVFSNSSQCSEDSDPIQILQTKLVALDDSVSVNRSAQAVRIKPLLNDTLIGAVNLSISNQPNHGQAVINGNDIIYTINPSTYCGKDSLTYQICDVATGRCDTGIVRLTIVCDEKDCLILNKNIGDVCDDTNVNTYSDRIQSNCTCKGKQKTFITQSIQLETCNAALVGVVRDTIPSTDNDSTFVIRTITTLDRSVLKPIIQQQSNAIIATLPTGTVGPFIFEWSINNVLTNITSNRINNPTIGTYKVSVRNAFGCVSMSDPFTVGITYDCPTSNKNIGDICDDNNANTENDKIQSDCTCKGTTITSSTITITCPTNIELTIPQGATYTNVSWNSPTVSGNCTTSGGTGCTTTNINGFTLLGEREGHQYYVSNQIVNWRDAKQLCINNGGYLAAITSQTETDFLKSKLRDMVFIGLNDENTEGVFQWTNGESSTYTNWALGQPAQSPQALTEDYAVFQNWDGKWDDVNGFVAKKVLLEINCGSNSTTTPPTIRQTAGITNGNAFPVGVTTVNYEAKDACNNVKTCSFAVTVKQATTTSGNSDYCASKGNTPWEAWIAKVNFKQINQQSNKEGYGNFKGTTANVAPNEVVPISITPSFSYTQYDGFVRVWIDFNGDKDFEDAGEMVVDKMYRGGLAGKAIVPITENITIPTTAKLGTTCMRISFRQNIAPKPCDVWSNAFGEVEDYSISIGSNVQALVMMGSLKVELIDNKARLDWVRRSNNIAYFEVEKSINGSDFVFLEKIYSNQKDAYHYIFDKKLIEGDNYYRLKIVQSDGSIEYSPIRQLFYEKMLDFIVFPNPANDEVWIDLKAFENRAIEIVMTDVAGKELLYEKIKEASVLPHRLDLSGIDSGSYFITIQTKGKRTIVRKLWIMK
jgi:GEVED domain/Lectin C-type domain/Secretion system C-terminal sorting domain/HYR domain/Bacterial Ig domain